MNKKTEKTIKNKQNGKNAGLYQIIPHKPYKRGLMYGVENQTTAATGNYTGNTCQRRNTERIRPFDTPLNKTNGKGSVKVCA